MQQYLELLRDVRTNGRFRADRTGTGTYGVFGRQARWDLSKGFPLLTTKKLFTRGIIAELLWILSGDTNENTLKEQGVNIWAEWVPKGRELTISGRVILWQDANPDSPRPEREHAALDKLGVPRFAEPTGDLGRIYGAQWRRWRAAGPLELDRPTAIREIDQITNLIHDLKTNPNSRRHIVTAWNPGELDQMALPPCHCFFQFYTEELTVAERALIWAHSGNDREVGRANTIRTYKPKEGEDHHSEMDAAGVPRFRLSCQLFQRSADIFLGVPFNIASYALLTTMVAQCVNMVPGDFVHTFGDLHIYANHLDQVDLQLTRTPGPLPRMVINPAVTDIFSFKLEDFKLENYVAQPTIKAPVSV